MRFERKAGSRRTTEVNMTPLVDLFLNILVFFLVTTTFASESVFYVELPEAKTGEAASARELINIDIGSKGEIAVDGEPSSLEDLQANLQTVPKEEREKIPVVMRADRGARHGQVVEVIDLVRDAGLRNVGIATEVTNE